MTKTCFTTEKSTANTFLEIFWKIGLLKVPIVTNQMSAAHSLHFFVAADSKKYTISMYTNVS